MKAARFAAAGALLLAGWGVQADPPRLYGLPALQSPVRGEPDDLLLLPGYGFEAGDTVVYAALADTTAPLSPPQIVPTSSTAAAGVAPVVSSADAPYSLTVQLPGILRSGQSYGLWVRSPQQQWSNGVRINDARPLWFSPAHVYASAALGALPRELKLVGRNLQAAPGAVTMVRLSGPQQLSIAATPEADDAAAVAHYVAAVPLPPNLAPGDYQVSLSRDGISWIALAERFKVLPDPPPERLFAVADYGCRADDAADDTGCVLQAIAAAAAAGGGTVQFGPGDWDLAGTAGGAVDGNDGIVVPGGVNLAGAGARSSRILRHEDWNRAATQPVFTLLGHNRVQGLGFADTRLHQSGDAPDPTLQLGKAYYRAAATPRRVEDVVIAGNVFDKVHTAVKDGGLPISRLFITGNVFGAYANDLELGGNLFDMTDKFRIDDSVVAYNLFEPGSYLDIPKKSGVIASEIGASRHLDFSHNIADGAATEFLNAPDDARGWRAGFFWHLQDNQEMSLMAQNLESCTGDKIGDGEAISFDNNANTFAFDGARGVLRAGPDSVTVAGPLQAQQNGRDVPLDSYYLGHWLQIGQGRGLGQVRKIVDYRVDAADGLVTFTVAPAWEVEPEPGARVSVGREFWQVYAVGNRIDHRRPLCQKSNRSAEKGGGITLWAQTADAAVEGNRQYDSDGILFLQSYSAADAQQPEFASWTFFQSFLEIRNNLVDGEYDWDADCSSSGIQAAFSAAPTPASPPPTMSYGVSIARNTVIHADSVHGGAIAIPLAWYEGPSPHDWPLVDSILIHHNRIEDIAGAAPRRHCAAGAAERRIGISLGHPMVWRTALYANSCNNVSVNLEDQASQTSRLCPAASWQACECAGSALYPKLPAAAAARKPPR
jgi:hypothetical protein